MKVVELHEQTSEQFLNHTQNPKIAYYQRPKKAKTTSKLSQNQKTQLKETKSIKDCVGAFRTLIFNSYLSPLQCVSLLLSQALQVRLWGLPMLLSYVFLMFFFSPFCGFFCLKLLQRQICSTILSLVLYSAIKKAWHICNKSQRIKIHQIKQNLLFHKIRSTKHHISRLSYSKERLKLFLAGNPDFHRKLNLSFSKKKTHDQLKQITLHFTY